MNYEESNYKKIIRSWCESDGIYREAIKDKRMEFVYRIEYARFHMVVTRPVEKDFIQIENVINISPEHQRILTPEKYAQFRNVALDYILTQDVDIVFPPNKPIFVILDKIYDDGLTHQRFFTTLRRIAHASARVIKMLNEILGTLGPESKPPAHHDEGPVYFT